MADPFDVFAFLFYYQILGISNWRGSMKNRIIINIFKGSNNKT